MTAAASSLPRRAWLGLIPAAVLLFSLQLAAQEPPFKLPPASELRKIRSGVMLTSKGRIVFELYPEDAPWHVANLKHLADEGFYRNVPFSGRKPGDLIQTGGRGGSPGYSLAPEFNRIKHTYGSLSMMRQSDRDVNRRSHGSRFFILLRPIPALDGQYTAFGKVIAGMDVVRRLRAGDVIKDLLVYVRD